MGFGFSVYFGLDNSREENLELLKKAREKGFTRIFTSLHIPEANYDILKEEVSIFFEEAKKYNMDIISDISPNTFKFLELKNMDIKGLYNLGVRTIRIDFGYTEEEIALMSRNEYGVKIQLNASTITKEFFRKVDKFKPNYDNVDALHNFYPRIGTGISKECMIEKNNILLDRGIKCCAFIQSNNKKRSPLKDGLPTLEDHRDKSVEEAANDLFALGNSWIFIGDSLPSDDELEKLSLLNDEKIKLRINVENELSYEIKSLLSEKYTSRVDEARDCIRASESRIYLDRMIVREFNTCKREKYNVTIDNEKYKRYMGELQILKEDMAKDERVNVVGKIIEEDYYLLEYIKEGKGFYFEIVN